jgi:Flp pilus assembly protein TadD
MRETRSLRSCATEIKKNHAARQTDINTDIAALVRAKQRRPKFRLIGVSSACDARERRHSGSCAAETKIMQPGANRHNTDIRCTSSTRSSADPKFTEQCPAWTYGASLGKPRRRYSKSCKPCTSTQIIAALAQPRSADPKFRLIGVSSARRGLCARETQSLGEAAPARLKIMQPGANRHQHRLFDALAQSRSSADPNSD